ncbi:uncharacterized protein LOC107868887 [Capsicum annuum]|uniref:uncharacterized protein LOC107868887 n=1 Tax=Capsicum annuum TaxID=4072 RepID=UPI0007BF0793|nr:uncharacterized protein LOC107868887 [Capsicum annuum]
MKSYVMSFQSKFSTYFLVVHGQYDKSTKHDGMSNKYSLKHGGKIFTLQPLSPSQVNELTQKLQELKENREKGKEPKSLTCGEALGSKKLNGEVSDSRVSKDNGPMVMLSRSKDLFKDQDIDILILLLAHTLNTNHFSSFSTYLPLYISLILWEFDDVFPEELPQGLPPIRGIEYQIYFVFGSQLSNKPAYRSNRTDTTELERQVEELLNKVYIKESMSLCAVPVLLVPKTDGT